METNSQKNDDDEDEDLIFDPSKSSDQLPNNVPTSYAAAATPILSQEQTDAEDQN